MDKPHVLLCVMGRTACGKDSLVNKLCKDNGCDIAVAGTSIFKASDRNKVVKGLLEL